MKDFGKGLWVILIGLGVVIGPGITLLVAEGSIPGDFEEVIPKDEGDQGKHKGKKTIVATCDIDPNKLNLKSNGKYITAYLELPGDYDVHDIVIADILLNDFISPEIKPFKIGDSDDNGIPDLMIKFNRSMVKSNLEPIQFCEIGITGTLFDGVKFEATCGIELLNFLNY
ncbi:MAG: hypothetical protein ACXAC5_14965 [Promethearchaeota archaeon]